MVVLSPVLQVLKDVEDSRPFTIKNLDPKIPLLGIDKTFGTATEESSTGADKGSRGKSTTLCQVFIHSCPAKKAINNTREREHAFRAIRPFNSTTILRNV